MRRPLLIALQLLTRLPTPRLEGITTQELGRSVLWYPVVGAVIGGLLALLNLALFNASIPLTAALLLAAWVLLTGALHLDGLGDSADAWLGGYGNRERTLAIMKDPRCGPAAVVSIGLLLLLKFAALQDITETTHWPVLLLIPVISRAFVLLLLLTTPYVRPGGMGELLAQHLPRRSAWLVLALCSALVLILGGRGLSIGLLVGLALVAALRQFMLKRIGGTTGDTTGALVEITEAALLVTVAVV